MSSLSDTSGSVEYQLVCVDDTLYVDSPPVEGGVLDYPDLVKDQFNRLKLSGSLLSDELYPITEEDNSDEPRRQEELEEEITELLSTPSSREHIEYQVHDSPGSWCEHATSARHPSQESSESTEAFPEYEPCEKSMPTAEDYARAEAYERALGRVAEDLNHSRSKAQGSPNIGSSSSSHHTAPIQQELSPYSGPKCPELSHHDHFCLMNEVRKHTAYNAIHDFLLKQVENLRRRRRFLTIVDMITELEYIHFRSKRFPVSPMDHLTQDDLNRVVHLGSIISKHLRVVHGKVCDGLAEARATIPEISELYYDATITVHERFTLMAKAVRQFVNRCNLREDNFLQLLLEFYEIFFYEDWHIMYNQYLAAQELGVSDQLRQISMQMNHIYRILNDLFATYQQIVQVKDYLSRRFMQPTAQELYINHPLGPQTLLENKCPTPEPIELVLPTARSTPGVPVEPAQPVSPVDSVAYFENSRTNPHSTESSHAEIYPSTVQRSQPSSPHDDNHQDQGHTTKARPVPYSANRVYQIQPTLYTIHPNNELVHPTQNYDWDQAPSSPATSGLQHMQASVIRETIESHRNPKSQELQAILRSGNVDQQQLLPGAKYDDLLPVAPQAQTPAQAETKIQTPAQTPAKSRFRIRTRTRTLGQIHIPAQTLTENKQRHVRFGEDSVFEYAQQGMSRM
ncbi:hypothetical protein BJX99DRAFT_15927 [Aspergillus californicus]